MEWVVIGSLLFTLKRCWHFLQIVWKCLADFINNSPVGQTNHEGVSDLMKTLVPLKDWPPFYGRTL